MSKKRGIIGVFCRNINRNDESFVENVLSANSDLQDLQDLQNPIVVSGLSKCRM